MYLMIDQLLYYIEAQKYNHLAHSHVSVYIHFEDDLSSNITAIVHYQSAQSGGMH